MLVADYKGCTGFMETYVATLLMCSLAFTVYVERMHEKVGHMAPSVSATNFIKVVYKHKD